MKLEELLQFTLDISGDAYSEGYQAGLNDAAEWLLNYLPKSIPKEEIVTQMLNGIIQDHGRSRLLPGNKAQH